MKGVIDWVVFAHSTAAPNCPLEFTRQCGQAVFKKLGL